MPLAKVDTDGYISSKILILFAYNIEASGGSIQALLRIPQKSEIQLVSVKSAFIMTIGHLISPLQSEIGNGL